tara:strand:- start:192 stop:428 length:237 start_codon:yes stop_codon:yes gene_type:complete
MASKLDATINSIVENATSSFAETLVSSQEKTAAPRADLNMDLTDVEGLCKLAQVLKETNIEPSYEDLYNFVGGLYGRH